MKKLFVANWKMQKSFDASLAFAHTHADQLKQLAQNKQSEIILCPSFPVLFNFAQFFNQTNIHIGAQTVSRHVNGPHTGQVSAQSLAEAGCTYCIIGHSETRRYQKETNVDIEHKCKELIKNNITPIICIGEPKHKFDQQQTFGFLEQQIAPILQAVAEHNQSVGQFVIAYEPIWAIGTGVVPEHDYLKKIFSWLNKQCTQHTQSPFSLLYGGSVNENNADDIMRIRHIDGLLIGGASLEFESLSAIITSSEKANP